MPATGETANETKISKGRILLVEDHQPSASALSFVLRYEGYEVQIAATYARACELAGEQTFDLIVSDVSLPDGDGYELLDHIYDRMKVRGIALTGFEEPDEPPRPACIQTLTKPVEFKTLLQLIQRRVTPHIEANEHLHQP